MPDARCPFPHLRELSDSRAVVTLLLALLAPTARAQPPRANTTTPARASTATRTVFLDDKGVIRWKDDRAEVALYGTNYVLPGASDYRAAGYLKLDRRRMIDEDMAHFARMGFDGLRLTLWGDWENADHAGNLVDNEHLALFDYLIARARERGIYMLLSPIQTYSSTWPDALSDTTPPGFSNFFRKNELGTNPAAIAAQVRYITQLLEHVNRYTGTKIKDEPAILFIEMINEPTHHSRDVPGSVAYINALVDAVRRTGCTKLLFHNVSQDFAIAESITRSKVDGVSFGWYPSGLNSGHELAGNYLRTVDDYERMRTPLLEGRPRIVYEFDSPDLRTGYMYPAMARAFRSVGTQFAAMFAYDMLGTASRNLGWQTHYLNLVYTPRKAMSAVIAAEAMRRLPRMQQYGAYPANARFGDFRVSYEENLSELVSDDAFMNAGSTRTPPRNAALLRRVAGYGSSPVVIYEGEGTYFLDRLREGVWRLEVYPDAMPVRDPFEMPSADKIVTRAISRAWPMRVLLPDLGISFTAAKVAGMLSPADARARTAVAGEIFVTPGVYLLGARGAPQTSTLPAMVSHLGLTEYHAPPRDLLPPVVETNTVSQQPGGRPVTIAARVVTTAQPAAVTAHVRAMEWDRYWSLPMTRISGYDYRAVVPDSLREGRYEYHVTVKVGDTVTTFPGGEHRAPSDWDYTSTASWPLAIVRPLTPLSLFEPLTDVSRMAFTRMGDGGRRGMFQVVSSSVSGAPAFRLPLPDIPADQERDYTASLTVTDRLNLRADELSRATSLAISARGLSASQRLHVTLVEHDGTSWTASVLLGDQWGEHTFPVSAFTIARGVTLPVGYPGIWNYWITPAANRGGADDRLRLDRVERLQFSVRPDSTPQVGRGPRGVDVSSVVLRFR